MVGPIQLFISLSCNSTSDSVTKLGDLLDFGQVFKAFDNN